MFSVAVVGMSLIVFSPSLVQAQNTSDISTNPTASNMPDNSSLTLPTLCDGITLTDDLAIGSSGPMVACLQALLNQDPDTMLSADGPGSPGNETQYYGIITDAEVILFQQKYASTILAPAGLSTETGMVGPNTRDALNKMIAEEGGLPMPGKPQ